MKRIFNNSDCTNLDYALKHEWIESNGLGGYAASTIINCATRKYHGLLISDLPVGKHLLLANLEDSLKTQKITYPLSTSQYPDAIHPQGYENIESFSLDLFPTTTFKCGSATIERSIMMPRGQNAVLLRYELFDTDKSATLKINPLLAFRNIHALTQENTELHVKTFTEKTHYKIQPYNSLPPMYFDSNLRFQFFAGPDWYRNIEYREEELRGYEHSEDLFSPGLFERKISVGKPIYIRVSTTIPNDKPVTVWNQETKRRLSRRSEFQKDGEALGGLKAHAEHFIIKNQGNRASITAGYPWFTQRGRDAITALPGLTFCCDRIEQGLEVLKTFTEYEKDGLLPNRFKPTPSYDSIDPSLWFFWAAQEYLRKTDDLDSIDAHLFGTMKNIIISIIEGNAANTEVKDNGLLWTGSRGTQLTWMDAVSWGNPVTSRYGMAIEVNALWYNALSFLRELATKLEENIPSRIGDITDAAGQSIISEFWTQETSCLADVVNDFGKDASIRPNQIFAVSLPYSALTEKMMKDVVTKVDTDLTTAYGLRTLSPTDPRYCGVYTGTSDERNSTYHQGTVWPSLTGHFVEAYLKTNSDIEDSKEYLRTRFKPLFTDHLESNGLHGVSEIFDGDTPHNAKGCFTHAWSVAETIRAIELLK